ncbi:Vacuolar protein sorting-associated protein 8 [Tulasnella sp. 427]|nr:Vacuolar protein sorting-associated protein 8 [Tulasnella sp. 427]
MPKESSASSVRSANTLRARDDERSTLRGSSPPRAGDSPDEDQPFELTAEDYAARRDSILSDGDDEEDDDDDDEEFVYTGIDAQNTGDYDAQLAEALGDDAADLETEPQLDREGPTPRSFRFVTNDEMSDVWSDQASSELPGTPPRSKSPTRPQPAIETSGPKLTPNRPYLHPTISRLRSVTPQRISHLPSSSSVTTLRSVGGLAISPSPSHFSAISRASSYVDEQSVSGVSEAEVSDSDTDVKAIKARDAFRWTELKIVSDYIFQTSSQKASAVLGTSWGTPTVMAANGFICIGTDRGLVVVFDFRQQFKCICGSEASSSVTALALSYDHTFLAVGYSLGHINLYEMTRPQNPVRSVPPTTLPAVLAGKKEGHLPGFPVTQIGFVATRHTAIVSSDDSGLAFYHSLGKVLFVEANDVLRILGKYPEDPIVPAKDPKAPIEPVTPTTPTPGNAQLGTPGRFVQRRAQSAILAMAPLPLGTSPHPTDSYNLIALLTPAKLVVVGLRPSPRTWFRKHRPLSDEEETLEEREGSKWRGCVAWYPSVLMSSIGETPGKAVETKPSRQKGQEAEPTSDRPPSTPTLTYSWARNVWLLKTREVVIKQAVEDKKVGGGKKKVVEVGQVILEEAGSWQTESDIVGLQWLNANQVIVLTLDGLEVYDIRSSTIVESVPITASSLTTLNPTAENEADLRISHSVRVYKGKVFILGRQSLRVGTLLTWADRILAAVEDGDFLSAINLACAYYTGNTQGNKNGLPEDPMLLHEVVGRKLRDLMVASAAYAFSEDRMTDRTHITPDGRGVDRTALFEGLVVSCIKAALALDDYDFLYENLYERYESSGITSIFLRQMEPFILDSSLRIVPTYVAQQLISMHGERGEYDAAEKVIWHLDPLHLDSNQAIKLCQQYELWDAMIYVYTLVLKDFVSPFVELLSLVRKVRQQAIHNSTRVVVHGDSNSTDSLVERLVPKAYKAYTYLESVLSGLTYPSQEALPDALAGTAKKDVYHFLFSGHSVLWPHGAGGKLVATADYDGGDEPTYPYLCLLLRFDAEAFLNALDIAFEDSYLNDSPQGISRQAITNILLKLLSPEESISPDLSSNDITFIRIFVSRNVPKYPQFIQIPPTAQQNLLIGLATDRDLSTREDRQLAAEFLLSAYTPHSRDQLVDFFEKAGFYRILRLWYRSDREWPALFVTYVRDPDVRPEELFSSINGLMQAAVRLEKGNLPLELTSVVIDALPQLLEHGITATASMMDRFFPEYHSNALQALGDADSYKQFVYLRALVEPSPKADSPESARQPEKASSHLEPANRNLYLRLICQYDPAALIPLLQRIPSDYYDPSDVVEAVDANGNHDVTVWLLDRQGKVKEAFDKLESQSRLAGLRLADVLQSGDDCRGIVEQQTRLVEMGTELCLRHSSSAHSVSELTSEDMWFQLLESQIEMVQSVASAAVKSTLDDDEHQDRAGDKVLTELRTLLQNTFSQLLSHSTSTDVSFPRLFKRLVDSTSASRSSTKSLYTEFRLILTGMLDSYRSEGDFLTLNNRLIQQDLHGVVAEGVKARSRGWRPKIAFCTQCQKSPAPNTPPSSGIDPSVSRLRIFRSGVICHSQCQGARASLSA